MKHRKTSAFALVAVLAMVQLTACGTAQSSESAPGSVATGSSAASSSAGGESSEEIIKAASAAGKIGNWGLGNEYEIQALLTKYGLPTDYITQDFTMDQFDSDAVTLASAMTYNELGLVVNSYDGGYNYGDSVATIDMNDEGVAMLEDNLFCSKAFAQSNPNTVKAFVSASMKGWYYACEHPDEAAQIVFEAGSSVSADHQAYIRAKFRYEDMMASKSILDGSKTFGQALDASGFKGDKKYRLSPDRYLYMFETHIEQGPILEDNGKDIGVVDCVLGMFNYRLKFYGQTTHAGTFPMPKRRDAFLAASQALCYLHEEIDKLGYPELVYTTGEVVCHPCVHTCVPDYFDFSFDARHEDSKVLEQVLAIVKGCADKTWAGCTCKVEKAWNRDTVYWNKKLVGYVKAAAEELGVSHQYIHSGAGHDAQFTSYMLPTTMIFVQSKDGLSHCEPEYSSPEHCTEGASVMLNAVLKADAE